MMYPKHIRKVCNDRKAIAPYNFVELPDQIIKAELENNGKLRDNDRYYRARHTGRIECVLTTSSPVYVRCGLTQEQFNFVQKQLREGKKADYPEFFYINPATKKPVIPGSSLRGMLRTLVEIISYSKIDRVSGHQRFFFRAVAADSDDPLKYEYSKHLGKHGRNVKAGYLRYEGNKWFIRPAMPIDKAPFIWVKESTARSEIPGMILMEQLEEYQPQYFINISFGDIHTKKNGRKFANKISIQSNTYQYKGVLVTSGNMLEGATSITESKRKNHCLICEPDHNASLIPICDQAIRQYRNGLTAFQKEPPFSEEMGVLENGRCIFYCQLEAGKPVTLFGQSPNFRIPYSPNGDGKAASAIDFVPEELRDASVIDLADAIFGFVRGEKQSEGIESSCSGRVFISDGVCLNNTDDVFVSDKPIVPQILSSPKPTTFQHYLVQPEETNAEKKNLKHYASMPGRDTVIRGHKLYWHKGSSPDIQYENPDNKASDSQLTQIKPIKPAVQFEFTIYFENLSNVELGALMWVFDIAQDNRYRLSLGMGKPLGMGAVKIEHKLYLSDRQQRYTQLFNGNDWKRAETCKPGIDYKVQFESYILKQLKQLGKFADIPRIRMLLAILSWQENPSIEQLEQTRYMEIERQRLPCLGDDTNEYKQRRVLPTPLQAREKFQQKKVFSENQVVEAKVVKIETKQVQQQKKFISRTIITYQIEGSNCPSTEKVNKQNISLDVGSVVKVRIEKFNESNVRKVKQVE